MTKVMIKVRVAEPGELLQALHAQTAARQLSGELAAAFFGLADDPNTVVCLLDWKSVESAKEYWSSLRAAAQVAEWHAVGVPEILVLEELPGEVVSDALGLANVAFRIVAVVAIAVSAVVGHAHDPHVHLPYSTDRVIQSSMTVTSSGSPATTTTISLLGTPRGSAWHPPKG